jgi:hypothetical protein
MAKKTNSKPKMGIGAKAAVAARNKKSDNDAPKTRAEFGKRSMAEGTARSAVAKPARPKSHARSGGKSVIGKAVGAVTATMSSVAESASSLFRRGAAKSR